MANNPDENGVLDHLKVCYEKGCGHRVGVHFPNDENQQGYTACLDCIREGADENCEKTQRDIWERNVSEEISSLNVGFRTALNKLRNIRRAIPKMTSIMDKQTIQDAFDGK